VAAVVDAVAAEAGSSVDVYGHSHGGIVAFGAAILTSRIRKLVLYEGWLVPDPLVYALPAAVEQRMDALLAAGDRDGVVQTLFRSLEDMSDQDMATLRAAPSWPGRVAAAHTVTREVRAETGARLDPNEAARIRVPVLLLTGEDSADPAKPHAQAVAAPLPDARVQVIPGQHVADILDPQRFVEQLLRFLHEPA
jgi:pimeloyl-ACP methyl ester carboxylesterase